MNGYFSGSGLFFLVLVKSLAGFTQLAWQDVPFAE